MKKTQSRETGTAAAEPLIRPLLHSIARTAELLGGVCQKTVYREVARGNLDAVKIGTLTRITDESLQRRIATLPAATIRKIA